MNDPYAVLGVSQNATDEQVKTAYRELAKKYHPDNYANNPLADLAMEKMKEINEAYDEIMKMRSDGAGPSSGASSYQEGGYYASSGYKNVRDMINAGRVVEAQSVLDAVSIRNRNAEWYFLQGSVMYRKGWINEAYTNFQNAIRLEPNNLEYRQAYERLVGQMNNGGFGGGFGGYNSGNPAGCNGCDICTSLLCADCCCQSMGMGC